MNAYEQYELKELEEMQETQVEKRFEIDSIDAANWAFRKISALEKNIAENEKLAQAEIKRINEWLENVNKSNIQSIEYFKSILVAYFVQQQEKDKKFKLSTPYGKVTSRNTTKWDYNEANLIGVLLGTPYIVNKPALNKVDLKKDCVLLENGKVALDGEILEGVTVTPNITYTVKAVE